MNKSTFHQKQTIEYRMRRAYKKNKNNMQMSDVKRYITSHTNSTNEIPSYNETESEDKNNIMPKETETNRYNPRNSPRQLFQTKGRHPKQRYSNYRNKNY